MNVLVIHQETGRIITTQEYRVVTQFVALLVKLDILDKHHAFDIIMESFDRIFV
jgi:hypothetical protein